MSEPSGRGEGSARRGFDIVCLSANHWTGLPTSKQHLMAILADRHRVLYLDPPIDVFSVLGRRRRWPKLRGLRAVRDGLWVLSTVSASSSSSPDWRLAHYEAVAQRVRRAADSLGFSAPVVWTFSPEQMAAVPLLDPSVTLYHAADDAAAMSPDPERTVRLESEHIARSDLVLVASAALLESLGTLTDRAHLLPNAADRRHYARVLAGDADATPEELNEALSSSGERPDRLPSGDEPLILFGGAAYAWFDVDLVKDVADLRADWQFALVGPLGREAAAARLPANVTRVGRTPYEEFPRYVAAADVCILPWRVGRFAKSADPIVLYEYLLCGKPVVATPFPAAIEHGSLVRTASSAAEFVSEIAAALEEDTTAESRRTRIDFGLASTWEDRAREAESLVEATLARKAAARGHSGSLGT